jgi:hypothetical protein
VETIHRIVWRILEPSALQMRPILCILDAGDDFLTGLQPDHRGVRSRIPTGFGAAALLCLALLALLVTAQLAHNHLLERDADHCQLCIALHSAAPIALAAAAVVLAKVGSPVPLLEARMISRHWNPKLFTRPPPFGC